MNKRANDKAKPATHGVHPETQRKTKPRVPGSESSKAKSAVKDARSAHDKDGNSGQRTR